MIHHPSEVVAFWCQAGPKSWFARDEAFDRDIRTRFEALHHAAARGELDEWQESAEGAFALVLLLDQFPRNLYRGSAHAYAADPLARRVVSRAIERGFDQTYPVELRAFFYLPFEHSEDGRDQARSVQLFEATGDHELVKWAQLHADIIARFGRFPHRNACLGRQTTDAERQFLAAGGFRG
jgi:uncharacterized protein (DUF924 family)